MRGILAYAAVGLIALAVAFHLAAAEDAAEVCGDIAFFALVAAVIAPAPRTDETPKPDAARDLALYEAHYADAHSARSFESMSKVDLFAALIKRAAIDVRGASVCDVGFGSGLLLEYLLAHGAGQLSGAELSATAVAKLQERYPSIALRCESADKTSFTTGEFDVVVCSHVLEHFEDEGAILAELARITRAGGAVIVGVPGTDSRPDPRHFRVYTKEGLESALRSHGLTPIETIVAGSRLVGALTPAGTVATAQQLETSRKSPLVRFLRRIYHALGVPLLRKMYLASVRSGSHGVVNEIWAASRRR